MSHDLTTTAGKIADFRDRQARAEQPSGPEAIEKQHARGKNTARERIDMLLDEDSFVEFDALAVHRSTAFGMEKKKPLGDGVVSATAPSTAAS
ncbi:probable propionyl-CoA carboxylase beta chain 5 [Arthrobacter sp. Hiyo8]|nr:probable propionyl-CoA carboxylase beta chain 5 [Arthrobacter sp. Hiyo8]